jgi:hypothetical protein
LGRLFKCERPPFPSEDEQPGIFWNHFVPLLSNENHERYSRLRAILVPPRAAVKAIGLKPTSGIATKLEKNKAIQARIAELVAVEEDVLREKRQQIESALSAIAYGDGSDFPGKRIAIGWPDRRGALNQLCDMHGFKAPNRAEMTGKDGGPIRTEDVSARDILLDRISGLAARTAASGDTNLPK